jgi:hypothetical protein
MAVYIKSIGSIPNILYANQVCRCNFFMERMDISGQRDSPSTAAAAGGAQELHVEAIYFRYCAMYDTVRTPQIRETVEF